MNENEKVVVQRNGSGISAHSAEAFRHYATPIADIYETRDAFVLMLDLPGTKRDAISLSVHSGTMVIKADVQPRQTGEADEVVREIRTPGYYRAFRIAEGIDQSTIDAQFDLGVLTVKLLKSPELKPREIPIH